MNLDAIEAAAKAAICVVPADREDFICEAHSEILFDGRCEDGVARIDPQTVLALIAVADAARAYSHWEFQRSSVDPEQDAVLSALDALAALDEVTT